MIEEIELAVGVFSLDDAGFLKYIHVASLGTIGTMFLILLPTHELKAIDFGFLPLEGP